MSDLNVLKVANLTHAVDNTNAADAKTKATELLKILSVIADKFKDYEFSDKANAVSVDLVHKNAKYLHKYCEEALKLLKPSKAAEGSESESSNSVV